MNVLPSQPPQVRPTALPDILHLGSGKSFRPDALNVDVDGTYDPDVVADLNQPFPGAQPTFTTDRFGTVTLAPNQFGRIIAHDVLEHISELTTCMRSCLDLLRVGGVFEILVPYDLSYGAWQDPTHLRAFNERSWLYYGDWCWYLGWDQHYLPTARLDYMLSPIGQDLQAKGVANDELLRTPRAVDAMYVELVKQPVPPALAQQAQAVRSRTR